MSFDLAVAVMIERSLAVRSLGGHADGLVERLDQRAITFRLSAPLAGSVAVYVRQLAGGDAAVTSASSSRPVNLPARLAARLARESSSALRDLLTGRLPMALAWERVAVSHAQTISEWAAWEAVALLSVSGGAPGRRAPSDR